MEDAKERANEILIRGIKDGRLLPRSRGGSGYYMIGTGVEDAVRKIVDALFENSEVREGIENVDLNTVIFHAQIKAERASSIQDKADIIAAELRSLFKK